MEERVHPIPFRTRQLSSPSSMILRILTWESRTTPRLYFQRAVFVRRPVVFCLAGTPASPPQSLIRQAAPFPRLSPQPCPPSSSSSASLPPGVLPFTASGPPLSSSHHPRLQRKSVREYTPVIPYKQLVTMLTSFYPSVALPFRQSFFVFVERIGNKFRRNVRCRNRQKDARIVAGSREAGHLLCGHTL